jgi:hypothetical protein
LHDGPRGNSVSLEAVRNDGFSAKAKIYTEQTDTSPYEFAGLLFVPSIANENARVASGDALAPAGSGLAACFGRAPCLPPDTFSQFIEPVEYYERRS